MMILLMLRTSLVLIAFIVLATRRRSDARMGVHSFVRAFGSFLAVTIIALQFSSDSTRPFSSLLNLACWRSHFAGVVAGLFG